MPELYWIPSDENQYEVLAGMKRNVAGLKTKPVQNEHRSTAVNINADLISRNHERKPLSPGAPTGAGVTESVSRTGAHGAANAASERVI